MKEIGGWGLSNSWWYRLFPQEAKKKISFPVLSPYIAHSANWILSRWITCSCRTKNAFPFNTTYAKVKLLPT